MTDSHLDLTHRHVTLAIPGQGWNALAESSFPDENRLDWEAITHRALRQPRGNKGGFTMHLTIHPATVARAYAHMCSIRDVVADMKPSERGGQDIRPLRITCERLAKHLPTDYVTWNGRSIHVEPETIESDGDRQCFVYSDRGTRHYLGKISAVLPSVYPVIVVDDGPPSWVRVDLDERTLDAKVRALCDLQADAIKEALKV